ncbi:MAG: acyl-CoA dehydrogenase C-terminal domain-containing protein [Pseudomonadales bacterium]|nr:acyl-CoA dehydrogenase C-terminal domain-containing protein [Pseudomonadales bacterium]
MTQYKSPIRDIQFVLHELLGIENHYQQLLGNDEVNRELIDAVIEEGAKFSENELAPMNQSGDEEGCHWDDGVVTTPKGFKEAYDKYVEGGWPSLGGDKAFGGQGLPSSLGSVVSEMVGSANWSWSMYPGLSQGAVATLESHGTEDQKKVYLTKLISGQWTGTMCLTEPQCGSDLGLVRTKAEQNDDGSYSISGTKIFISAGEHDMAENIVHIVLARLPGAPEGTKGISLFIVPKFNVKEGGANGERNTVQCGSIEHKMGIKASATCVLNFDNAKGFLIGPENRGLNCMFTFMNVARVGTSLQGVCAAECAFQGALEYAKDRLAMRSLSGPKNPEKEADPIIVHPDVRRMLLTQKAFAEGGRALCYYLCTLADIIDLSKDEKEVKKADDLMAFITPIAKAFLTESGLEAASYGMQVYGGHGFISEWGMEQIVRDARISTLYEGTTGIQSLDLLGRKVLLTQGQLLRNFTGLIETFCKENAENEAIKELTTKLASLNAEWVEMTMKVGMAAMQNQDEVGGASVDYLMYSGYVTLAFIWAKMALVASNKLAEGSDEKGFYTAKLQTAQFYYRRILPRTLAHKAGLEGGLACLMDMEVDNFSF